MVTTVVWRGRRLDRAVARRDRRRWALELLDLLEKVLITVKATRLSSNVIPNSMPPPSLYTTAIPPMAPLILVADARPHLAMTFSLVAPLLVGEGSVPLLCRPSGDSSRVSFTRCVPPD